MAVLVPSTHGELPGKPARLARKYLNYLAERGVARERLHLIPQRLSHERLEVRLVDRDTILPKPETLAAPSNPKFKFDEYRVCGEGDLDCAISGLQYEDQAARLSSFAEALRRWPRVRGVIVAASEITAAREREFLVKAGVADDRIILEVRPEEDTNIELWMIQPR